ncbi:MAG: sulfite exporter TauE/SafE family protein [Bacteroidales bacterium]|nr:sulfite exporter TauE/SafE family protein [Bacteroidales bacterium]
MEPILMINLKQLILLIVTGLVAGFVSGTLGVGGAIIIVPFLVYLLGMHQHEAQGTSLLVLVLPVGIFALLNYAKSGYVNYKFAFVLVIMFVIGSYFGSKFAISLPEKTLQKIFALLLLAVAIKILTGK